MTQLSPSAAAHSTGRARVESYRKETAVPTSTSAAELRTQATAISNGIGSLHREHYGRGADRIRTSIQADFAMTVLEDCFTVVERKMIEEGAFGQVRETRTMFQDWMRPRFAEIVETRPGERCEPSSPRWRTTRTWPSSSSSSRRPRPRATGDRRTWQRRGRNSKIPPRRADWNAGRHVGGGGARFGAGTLFGSRVGRRSIKSR